MKKLILVAAFGLLGSPALAQNTATSTQSGSGHQADITQTGSVNEATITQAAQDNIALISQGVNGNAVGNTATITQTGSNNDGSAQSAAEGASIVQRFAQNSQATADQSGDGGYVNIWQGTAGNGLADAAVADVTQGGTGNTSHLAQGDSGHNTGGSVTIFQAAGTSGGQANVYQGHGVHNESSNDVSSISQNSGANNFGQIAQSAEYWDGQFMVSQGNTATIDQDGSNNQARVNQAAAIVGAPVIGGTATNNLGVIDQFGDNNSARLNQGIDGTFSDGNQAWIFQTTDGNTATSTQTGSGSTSTITQN